MPNIIVNRRVLIGRRAPIPPPTLYLTDGVSVPASFWGGATSAIFDVYSRGGTSSVGGAGGNFSRKTESLAGLSALYLYIKTTEVAVIRNSIAGSSIVYAVSAGSDNVSGGIGDLKYNGGTGTGTAGGGAAGPNGNGGNASGSVGGTGNGGLAGNGGSSGGAGNNYGGGTSGSTPGAAAIYIIWL